MTKDFVDSIELAKKERNEIMKREKSYFSMYNLPRPETNNNGCGGDRSSIRKSILRVKTQKESLRRSSKQGMLTTMSSFFGKSSSSFSIVSKSSRSSISGLRISLRKSLRSKSTNVSSPSAKFEEPTAHDSTISFVSNKRQVSFDKTHARSYHIECSDNPACSGKGPAVHLSWQYKTLPSISVEEYEGTRPENPRKMEDLKMNVVERERLLQEAGVSRKEMREFTKKVYKAKMKRLQTVENLKIYGKANMDKAERRMEQRESMVRSVLRLLRLRSSASQEQVKLWRKAHENQNSCAAAAAPSEAGHAAVAAQ